MVTDNDAFKTRIVRPHPVTESIYFNRFTCRNDLMLVFSSVIIYIIYNDWSPSIGSSRRRRLDATNVKLKAFYNDITGTTSRLEQLTINNLMPGGMSDWAALAGPIVKAANARQARSLLKDIANAILTDITHEYQVAIYILIDHVLEFDRVMYTSGRFLTQEELISFTEATQGVCKMMQLLRSIAKRDKQLLWHIVRNTHCMQHFPAEAASISSRYVQCYIEESFIGKIAKVWSSSKHGPYAGTIQAAALLKHLMWVIIEMEL